MHKTFLLYSWLLLVTHHTHTSELFKKETESTIKCTLPDANTLRSRLSAAGFDPLVQTTTIIEHLADRTMTPEEVAKAVQSQLYLYMVKVTIDLYLMMQKRKPSIIRAVLQDHPDAIKYLNEKGVLREK